MVLVGLDEVAFPNSSGVLLAFVIKFRVA